MWTKLRYNRVAWFAGALGIALAAPGASQAQSDYPNKPIRVEVGYGAGGPSDIVARIVAAKTGEILGQQFLIENKVGAAGMIAAYTVARSAPDGYTLLNTPTSYSINETLSKTMRSEIGKDFVAVAPQAQSVNILVVHPSLGVKTVAELVSLAKSKPGEIFYGTSGVGSSSHLCTELFNLTAGIKTTPVHYRGGGDSVKDLMQGEIKMIFATIAPVQQLVKDGKLIGLATTGLKRDASFPELPTIAESGYPGFDCRYWIGLSAPVNTPRAIIKRLEEANNKAIESPDVQKSLAVLGFSPMTGSSEDFDKFYRSERDRWGTVVRATGMDKE
jgi:tripartite-type tricarboxylate transporter receptor subunit TctC